MNCVFPKSTNFVLCSIEPYQFLSTWELGKTFCSRAFLFPYPHTAFPFCYLSGEQPLIRNLLVGHCIEGIL